MGHWKEFQRFLGFERQRKPVPSPVVFDKEDHEDDDHIYVPVYIRRECTPFEKMMKQVRRMDLTVCCDLATDLYQAFCEARRNDSMVEPLHVQFVGLPRQCKTQVALRLTELLKAFGFLCVSRSSDDAFFDDLKKNVSRAVQARNEEGEYEVHPQILDAEERQKRCEVDALFLDEVYAQKRGVGNDLRTILTGVTPMDWRPLMADPRNKGSVYKPLIWITTANHEITEHDYSVTAVLKRVHQRYVVEDAKFYKQNCHEIVEAAGDFVGGFKTCRGTFGRWNRRPTTRTVTTTTDACGRSVVTESISVGEQTYAYVKDTSGLTSFRCEHCVPLKYAELLEEIMRASVEKINRSVEAREDFKHLIRDAVARVGRSTAPVTSDHQSQCQ